MGKKVLVAGAGGFIGGHLTKNLLEQGYDVRCVDIKPVREWWQKFHQDTEIFDSSDLKDYGQAQRAVQGCQRIINLACDMGGMGFIENNRALCMLSVLINTNLLRASQYYGGIERFFYASSACAYNIQKQDSEEVVALKEDDAYPAMPELGYGWEKLFSEMMCIHFREDFGIPTRIARFHNCYGSFGEWTGGREKAPAAVCRKIAEAKKSGNYEIEIWGDGNQRRTFMYINDCIKGINMISQSDFVDPINLGTSEMVTINELVDIVEQIAGIKLERHYKLDAPLGVRGRNSDNTLIRKVFGWEPSTPLKVGLEQTYKWIYDQV